MFGFDDAPLAFGAAPTSFTWATGAEPIKVADPNPKAWTTDETKDVIGASVSGLFQLATATGLALGNKPKKAPTPSYIPVAAPPQSNTPSWILPVVGIGAVLILGLTVILAVTGGKKQVKPSSPFATG